MNILFLLIKCPDLSKTSSFYSDLAVEFRDNGHDVTIIASADRDQKEGIYNESEIQVIRTHSINSEGVKSVIKKGIALLMLPYFYNRAYKKYLNKIQFDLIFLPTPPITLINLAISIKRKSQSKLYLILRDIHPECDYRSGYYKNNLFYKLIFKFLHSKAQLSYIESDLIGCMSPQNMHYVKELAPMIDPHKVVLLPNWKKSMKIQHNDDGVQNKNNKDGKFVTIFGGNLGKAQDIKSILILARRYQKDTSIMFLIVGKGIMRDSLQMQSVKEDLRNIKFIDFLPKDEYETLLNSADLGLIIIDPKYGAPTCPSKVISYMANKIPVLAMINRNSDYGEYYIDASGCGLWSAGDVNLMFENFEKLKNNVELRKKMGLAGYDYFINNLTTNHAYNRIIEHLSLTSNGN